MSTWLEIADEIGPQFAAGVAERDANDTFVADHYPIMKERGLISALVPEEFGGGGAKYSEVAAMLRRLGYYDASTALALSMHQHLVAAQVFNHLHGRPAPLLPRVGQDNMVLVSTGARDWMESNGTVEKVEGGFRVSAQKAFASGSPAGAVAVTSAPYDHPTDGPQVLHFGVPLSAEGVSLADDWYVHGMRSTGSRTIVLKDVFVPEATISLARPRKGFAPIFNIVMGVAMPFITGVYVGVAERAVGIGIELARKRAGDPIVQMAAGQAVSALRIAQTCHDAMVRLTNEFDFTPSEANSNEVLILKTQAVGQAKLAVERAIEASGGSGFYRTNGLERLLRDVSAGHYHPLPEKQQMILTGRLAVGLPAMD
ncbi:MAG: acyl-CoA dehydrogenase family protein [Dehalococcoidia bacterium]